jgi:hypothetical protein
MKGALVDHPAESASEQRIKNKEQRTARNGDSDVYIGFMSAIEWTCMDAMPSAEDTEKMRMVGWSDDEA